MSIQFATEPALQVDRVEHTPPTGVTWHPFADIFPWIEGPAFRELVEDVRKNGVLEPIVFLDGAILDGRNRYMAARELGIEYPRVEYHGDDPLGFVISHNLTRRHLDAGQRARVAAKIANMQSGARTDIEPSANLRQVSIDDAARMMNVSPRMVDTARKVDRDGAPELIAAVDAGEASMSAAALVTCSEFGRWAADAGMLGLAAFRLVYGGPVLLMRLLLMAVDMSRAKVLIAVVARQFPRDDVLDFPCLANTVDLLLA